MFVGSTGVVGSIVYMRRLVRIRLRRLVGSEIECSGRKIGVDFVGNVELFKERYNSIRVLF